MDVTDRNTNGTYASPDGGNGTGPGPDRKTALPEETTDWSLDQQQALYDPGFTYPGHRAFFNGVNELSNEYIEDCVTKRADLAEKRRIRNTAAHRVEALRKDVAGIRASESHVEVAVETLALDVVHAAAESELARQREQAHLERQRQASEKLNAKVPGLSLPVALLFLAGAFLFAAADYGIAHNIAGNVLDFNDWESVIFAVSIACMPLILKPFVDRYVEEPHHDGGRPKFTRHFYFTVGLLALVYLGLFGWVRYAEERLTEVETTAQIERETIQTQVEQGLTDASALPPAADPPARLHRLPFYIMSGSLAALAGAICLVMAFGPLPKHWDRLRYWFQVVRKKRHRLTARADGLRAELNEQRKALATRRVQLASFERLRQAEQQLIDAQAEEFRVGGELVKLYTQDEYQRGGAYELGQKLTATVNRLEGADPDEDADAEGRGNKQRTRTGEGGPTGGSSRRPSGADPLNGFLHQQLRQHIMRGSTNA